MPIKSLILLLFLNWGHCCLGQTGEDYFGTWTVLYGDNRITEKMSIPVEGILRHYEFLKHYEFSFFRTGLNYRFTPRLSGSVGYAYLDSEPFKIDQQANGAPQHWIFEQLNLKTDWSRFKISHRLRLENRWILREAGTTLTHRMRYRLRFLYPLGKKLYLNAFNEIFIGLQKPLFNQNRLHFGIGYKANSSIRFEAGYLKVHFATEQFESIRFAMLFKTDFRKNKNTKLALR